MNLPAPHRTDTLELNPADTLDEERAPKARSALGWFALVACLGGAIVLTPLVVPLVLAVWVASIARPVFRRLTKLLGGRSRSAAVLAVVLLLSIIVPASVLVANLAQSATDLATVVAGARGSKARLRALVQEDKAEQDKPVAENAKQLKQLAEQHAEEAKDLGKMALIFTVAILIFLFIFSFGFYAALAEGDRGWRWLQDHAPLRRDHVNRLADAFLETGRGLLASVGITAVIQGVLCTIIYLLLGVPRAWVLGSLSAVFSIMPVVGTPLIWGPVALGLQMTGETTKALILLAVGAGVIGMVENLVSPFFAKLARFKLPTFLLVASMFGGTLALGPSGLVVGPLLMRLAQEALAIAREEKLVGSAPGPIL